MRFLIQHTEHPASIKTIASTASNSSTFSIPHWCIVYIGFHRADIHDYQTKIDKFIEKIQSVKIFRLPHGDKIDVSLTDTGWSILLVPNFTLYSRNQKGSSVDYTHSASFADGKTMRDYLCKKLDASDISHITWVFGAQMHITATIDGPINHVRDY